MFSSDPVSGRGAGFSADMPDDGANFSDDLFVDDLFASDLYESVEQPMATKPSILGADEAAALLRSDRAGLAWMPDDMDLGDETFGETAAAPSARDTQIAAIRAQAQEDAEAALQQALVERDMEEAMVREQIQAEAYAAGAEAGRAEVEAAVQEAVGSALQALYLATEEVRTAEARWLGTLADNIAALVAGAARAVIGREVETDSALVRDLAKRAVAEYPQDQPVHVRVNPADLATLKAVFAEEPRTGDMRWSADARVERGGCLVEGRDRIVDGRVDTALERIYRRLSGHQA